MMDSVKSVRKKKKKALIKSVINIKKSQRNDKRPNHKTNASVES